MAAKRKRPSRPNATGRNEYQPYIRLHRGVTESVAWNSLSCEARSLLLLVWGRHNGANNGKIPLSHREARSALKIGNGKIQRAFSDLQERGFLIARIKGSFDWKVRAGSGRATEWELATEPCDDKPPRGDYRHWKKKPAVPKTGTAGSDNGNRSSTNIVPIRSSGS